MTTPRSRLLAVLFVSTMVAMATHSASAATATKPPLSPAARRAISQSIGIDPFFHDATLTASNGAESDDLGFSVSAFGDTVVVGAPNVANQRGAVYVFVKPAAGWESTSAYQARLTASDGAAEDFFGGTVAISGDTVVVGAYAAKVSGRSEQGAAYVYVKPASGWTSTAAFDAKLTPSDSRAGDNFGYSVAIQNDAVVAGAPGANDFRGSVYVFEKPASGWESTTAFSARLTASDGVSSDDLGYSVAISGDALVAGARGANGGAGAAYVFVEPASGWATTGAFSAKLTAPDSGNGDAFGAAVAISGNTIVAGAPVARIGGHGLQGAAYVFVKPATGWATTSTPGAMLTASDGAAGDVLGASVAVSNDTVIVGAPRSGRNDGSSAAYVFVMPAGGWATTSTFDARLTSSDPPINDGFGSSVALTGETAVIGDPGAEITHPNQGAAYLFGGFTPPVGQRKLILVPPPSPGVPVTRNP